LNACSTASMYCRSLARWSHDSFDCLTEIDDHGCLLTGPVFCEDSRARDPFNRLCPKVHLSLRSRRDFTGSLRDVHTIRG
jgi:hypothetical protein